LCNNNAQFVTALADTSTFTGMYALHQRAVYGTAYRILGNAAQAQDVCQDVFLRIWRRPDSFDARRGELGSYLRLMARSRALDLWREGQSLGRAEDRLKAVAGVQPEPQTPALAVERAEDQRVIREAVAALPEHQREAVVLAYWGGLTADEVARRTDVPLGTAKSRIRLGLARLRRDIRLCDGDHMTPDSGC
jgi:RNA polymerase sigma-70 factor (ECF subfamily)